jgi:hypothetical protein
MRLRPPSQGNSSSQLTLDSRRVWLCSSICNPTANTCTESNMRAGSAWNTRIICLYTTALFHGCSWLAHKMIQANSNREKAKSACYMLRSGRDLTRHVNRTISVFILYSKTGRSNVKTQFSIWSVTHSKLQCFTISKRQWNVRTSRPEMWSSCKTELMCPNMVVSSSNVWIMLQTHVTSRHCMESSTS